MLCVAELTFLFIALLEKEFYLCMKFTVDSSYSLKLWHVQKFKVKMFKIKTNKGK